MAEPERETVANSELLYKQTNMFGQSYKQHFFRFLKPPATGGCYSLQFSSSSRKVNEIKLENVLCVEKRSAKSQDYAFVIHCLNNKYQFACTSLKDMERWLGTLRKELLSTPAVASPGQDTVGVEIDATPLSRNLQLGGLYLLEVTQSDIILWLPRSRKETIRWSLSCIHSLDHVKPADAQVHRVIIELNEMSATGQGTLIFKADNGHRIVELVERYTGKKVQGLAASLKGHKSIRKRSSSQENLRQGSSSQYFDSHTPNMGHLTVEGHANGLRNRARVGSESNFNIDPDAPMLPPRPLPGSTSVFRLHSLQPLSIPSFGQTSHPSSPPFTSGTGHNRSIDSDGAWPPEVRITPAGMMHDCSRSPQVAPRPLNMSHPQNIGQSASDHSLNSSGDHHGMKPIRSPSWDGNNPPSSPRLSIGSSPGTPPVNMRASSPLFGSTPPALPPRPSSPSVSRSSSGGGMPPSIPPRPQESLEIRGPRSATMAPARDFDSAPPVAPRSAVTLPAPHRDSSSECPSPIFPRRFNYENTEPSKFRPR